MIPIKEINDLVLQGKLPIAFYNSTLEHNKAIVCQKKNIIFEPYKQGSLPLSDATCIVSKIYHVY